MTTQGITTADWALIISLFSFLVSLAGFVWNVWSKFIYPRAKVRTYIAVMEMFDGNGGPTRKTIQLSATNYGPTDITLHNHQAKRRQGFLGFRRNRHIALLSPVDHPSTNRPVGFFAPGFPEKLAVGESVSIYFAPDSPKHWVEENDLYQFGFNDTFGRYHWCSRRNAKKFRQDVINDFGAVEPKRPTLFEKVKLWTAAIPTKAALKIGG